MDLRDSGNQHVHLTANLAAKRQHLDPTDQVIKKGERRHVNALNATFHQRGAHAVKLLNQQGPVASDAVALEIFDVRGGNQQRDRLVAISTGLRLLHRQAHDLRKLLFDAGNAPSHGMTAWGHTL